MRWRWGYVKRLRRAWILDEDGFTVIGPVLSRKAAVVIVHAHNQAIEEALA